LVGATGAVGSQIIECLEERDFPVGSIRFFASPLSVGQVLEFRDEPVVVEELRSESFAGIDLAFFAAGREQSREFCPAAHAAGAVCIDCSDAWRMDNDVPLVIPEVNPQDMALYTRKGIVANPGSASLQLALALKPLHDAARIRRLVVATYQAVSGNGRKGVEELRVQSGELLNGRPAPAKVFPHQVAFNVLPQGDEFLDNGYTREEMALVHESRKILGAADLEVTATAAWVPVFYGHSEAVNVETEEPLSPERARALLAAAPGIQVVDSVAEKGYPMPVDAGGQDRVYVGRLREDASVAHGLNLWIVADNLRKGAATNCLQIAEILTQTYL
jgi:aspartate-semialdehyde dehydrogenase